MQNTDEVSFSAVLRAKAMIRRLRYLQLAALSLALAAVVILIASHGLGILRLRQALAIALAAGASVSAAAAVVAAVLIYKFVLALQVIELRAMLSVSRHLLDDRATTVLPSPIVSR